MDNPMSPHAHPVGFALVWTSDSEDEDSGQTSTIPLFHDDYAPDSADLSETEEEDSEDECDIPELLTPDDAKDSSTIISQRRSNGKLPKRFSISSPWKPNMPGSHRQGYGWVPPRTRNTRAAVRENSLMEEVENFWCNHLGNRKDEVPLWMEDILFRPVSHFRKEYRERQRVYTSGRG